MLICIFTGFSSGLPLYLLLNLRARRGCAPRASTSRRSAVRAGAVPVHVEVPVVAAARPLRAAVARPPARLDARDARRAASRRFAAHGLPRSAAPDLDHRVPRGRGRVLLGEPRHRDGRVPPRAPARRRARPRQLVLRQRVPHLEPGAGLARADPRRPHAVVVGVRHHRAVPAAGPRDDARRERARGDRRRAEDAARRGGRAVSRVHHALGLARRAADPARSSSSTSSATAWPPRSPRRSTSRWASPRPTSASSPRTRACGRAWSAACWAGCGW